MNKSPRLKIFRFALFLCLLTTSLLPSAFAESDSISSVTSQDGVTVTVISETRVASAPTLSTVKPSPDDQLISPPSDITVQTENATDSSPADTEDLWQRIRNGFALKPLDSPLVATHVEWYAERPDYLRRTIERSKMYLFHIMEEVQKRGMPAEIALLPIVESAFNPMAYSRSHASGIWQFIPTTGKDFGLKQNNWYDGRRDIVAATDAALDYLERLHDIFGTWDLALAAYNCGEGCVARAIAKNEAEGLPTDYLSLSLPAETRHYVPKLMAVKEIISDPAIAGISLDSIPNQAYFVAVSLHKSIDVKLAAKLADMPVKDFKSLNPAFTKPVVRWESAQPILLPVDKAEAFSDNLKNYDHPLVSWQFYSARRGERATTIARKFHVTLAWLKLHNKIKLTRKGRLAANYSLMLPLRHNTTTRLAVSSTKSEPATRHERTVKVKRGDTLGTIAQQHHVSIAEIKRWNHIRGTNLRAGSRIVVAETNDGGHRRRAVSAKRTKHAKTRHYTVKRGDSLSRIAEKFDVSVKDIQHWNRIKHSSTIKPGTKLVLN